MDKKVVRGPHLLGPREQGEDEPRAGDPLRRLEERFRQILVPPRNYAEMKDGKRKISSARPSRVRDDRDGARRRDAHLVQNVPA